MTLIHQPKVTHYFKNAFMSLTKITFLNFGRYLSELAQLVPIPYSQERSTHFFDRLHDISVTIPRCYLDVYVNSFFPCRARLWILCL